MEWHTKVTKIVSALHYLSSRELKAQNIWIFHVKPYLITLTIDEIDKNVTPGFKSKIILIIAHVS